MGSGDLENWDKEESVAEPSAAELPPAARGGSRLISRLLPGAIRLWIQTQVDHVEALTLHLEGRDRQILGGHIPQLRLSATRAVYRGIHLSQIAVTASDIRLDWGPLWRRQPLRVLAPFAIEGDLHLTTEDFNWSLQSPLLGQALYDFLRQLAAAQPQAAALSALLETLPAPTLTPYYRAEAAIAPQGITLRLTPRSGQPGEPITIATQVVLEDGHRLVLQAPHWGIQAAAVTPLPALHGFAIDLGSTVHLTTCRLEADQLWLAGTLQVLPDA